MQQIIVIIAILASLSSCQFLTSPIVEESLPIIEQVVEDGIKDALVPKNEVQTINK